MRKNENVLTQFSCSMYSKGAEPEFRSPRVKLLWDRWRHVWMLAWERQRRLQDKYNYIQELDRVANFSWEDWRKRVRTTRIVIIFQFSISFYSNWQIKFFFIFVRSLQFLKFMNHKKSRLTDLFRKMDKNNDGLIPREDFIQGIMNTSEFSVSTLLQIFNDWKRQNWHVELIQFNFFIEFETSRLEMGAVADLFDQHGEGLIDWKEFIAALRPDWEERRTYNDTDKIHDEVKRLVMLCTCRQKFRVFQVGEGKYRVYRYIWKLIFIFFRLLNVIHIFYCSRFNYFNFDVFLFAVTVRGQSKIAIGTNSTIDRNGTSRWWLGSFGRIFIKKWSLPR